LSSTLGVDESANVTIHEFDTFLLRWGPLRESLGKSSAVCTRTGHSQPWFRCTLSRQEVEKEFAERAKSESFSWLLRYGGDARQKDFLVWSHTSNKGDIKHVLIQNGARGYFLKNEAKPAFFPTVVHLLQHYSKDGMTIPNDVDVWANENKASDPEEAATRYQSYDAEDHDETDEAASSPSTSDLSSSVSPLSTSSTSSSITPTSAVDMSIDMSDSKQTNSLIDSALARLRKRDRKPDALSQSSVDNSAISRNGRSSSATDGPAAHAVRQQLEQSQSRLQLQPPSQSRSALAVDDDRAPTDGRAARRDSSSVGAANSGDASATAEDEIFV